MQQKEIIFEDQENTYDRYVDLKTLNKKLSILSKYATENTTNHMARSKSKCENRCMHQKVGENQLNLNKQENIIKIGSENNKNISNFRSHKCLSNMLLSNQKTTIGKGTNRMLAPLKKETNKIILNCNYVGLFEESTQKNQINYRNRSKKSSPLKIVISRKQEIKGGGKPLRFYHYANCSERKNSLNGSQLKKKQNFSSRIKLKFKQFEELTKKLQKSRSNKQCIHSHVSMK